MFRQLSWEPVFTAGNAATFAMLAGIIIWWIRGMPERGRVKNERKSIDMAEMDKLLADYGEQIKAARQAIHDLRNELHVALGALSASDRVSDQRHNWIGDMLFIIELLISELERLDPKSMIVKQAKAMLKRIKGDGTDNTKSEVRNATETAARDARQSARSAEHAVVEVVANENAKDAKK